MHRRKIVIVAPEGATLQDVVGPWEVFCRAAAYAPDAYEVHVAAVGADRQVGTKFGLPIVCDVCLADLALPLDTVIVAGSDAVFTSADAAFIDWLRTTGQGARRLGSVCTGAFYLGHAGLLDGRRATTHWRYLRQLAELFPLVQVDPDPIFVRDGPLFSSAGITAGIDLALALVEEDCGAAVSAAVARDLVVFVQRQADQSQLSASLAQRVADRDPIRQVQRWAPDNLALITAVDDLAAYVNIAPRTFSRLFKRQTGVTPGAYLRQLRLEAARRRLHETPRTSEAVAAQVGFGSARTLRRAMTGAIRSRR